jgi:V8-like Glu-specific endopeptidase
MGLFNLLHMRSRPISSFRSHSRGRIRLVILGVALAVIFVWPVSRAFATGQDTTFTGSEAPVPAVSTEEPEEPCLPEDPFELEKLRTAISADPPPTAPVTINRFLSIRYVASGQLIDEPAIEPAYPEPDEPGDPEPTERPAEEVPIQDTLLHVFNTETGHEFAIDMHRDMLKGIHDCRVAAGLASATEGLDDPSALEDLRTIFLPFIGGIENDSAFADAMVQPAARSNGIDTRIIRNATTSWPWRTISHFNNNCTGTLVGPRLLITAAHCINQRGTNNWFSFTVRPGRNGATIPFGSSTISLTPPPGQSAWYFTHPQWRNPQTTNARQWDWGLIVIPDRLGNQTGWMGYVALGGNTLKANNQYNRGYPACGGNRPDVPVNCQAARLYGDTATCKLGSFSFAGPDGWNRLINHSCDTSGGHSGSAMYQYFFDSKLGKTVPVVSGVHVASQCDVDLNNDGVVSQNETCGAADFFPSIVRRTTPGDLPIISWLREAFP